MGRSVRKMAVDAVQAIDFYKIKSSEVRGLDIYQHGQNPVVRLTPIAFEQLFRAIGLSISKVKRDDSPKFYNFEFGHRGVVYRCWIDREEVEEFALLTREQPRLPEPSVRINAKSQLLLGSST